MDTTFIYALNDPETGECRYVGKANDPHDRLFGPAGHLKTCHKKNHHRANWVKSLLSRGLRPALEILQEVPKAEWKTWERAWIKASKEIGMDLVNATPGGEGGSAPGKLSPMFGKHHKPETCEKISASKRGKKRSAESIAKQIASATGKKRSPAMCAKMSVLMAGEKNPMFGKTGDQNPFFGCSHSEESIAKMTGKKREPETCAKMRGKRDGASDYHGVCPYYQKWRARISVSGKRISIGIFSNEIEAAQAYDIAAKIHHGAHAILNFPD